MDNVLAIISIGIGICMSAVSLYIAVRKAPFDIRKLTTDRKQQEAELADRYLEMTDKVSAVNVKLRDEIQQVRERMDAINAQHTAELAEIKTRYENEMQEIRAALLRAEDRAAKFEDWAKRLVAQVESLGEVPVPFEPMKRNSRPVK